MTSWTRVLAGVLIVASAVAGAEAAHQSPGTAGTASPASAALTPVRVDLLMDRVWVVEGSGAVSPGVLYVFLSDHVMVTSSPGKPATVGTWAEDVTGLVWTDKGTSTKADVLELTPVRLRLRVKGRTPAEIAFVPAVRVPSSLPQVTDDSAPTADPAAAAAPTKAVFPVGSPYRCGGDALRVAFEGEAAYITWPDGTTVVLREVKTAEATPSRRTFSDGQLRVVEDTSESYTRVLFARAGFRPRPCSPTR